MGRRASIEWLDPAQIGGCLRIGGENFSWERMDDFDRMCCVKRITDDLIEVKGWAKPKPGEKPILGITAADWRAMGRCFAGEGFRRFRFQRKRKDGTIRHCEMSLAMFARPVGDSLGKGMV